MRLSFRHATRADVPALQQLIDASVRGLQAGDYTPIQIEGALGVLLGVDTTLIDDQTYFIAESESILVGCGGWSMRKTLFGADRADGRENAFLDPLHDAAKIRAIFVHPAWARRGIGSRILEVCENAAIDAGFKRFEMGSTLTGVPLYKLKNYVELETIHVPLPNGAALPVVRMIKTA
jgi:GNAT superfamily N-acetyltransferase